MIVFIFFEFDLEKDSSNPGTFGDLNMTITDKKSLKNSIEDFDPFNTNFGVHDQSVCSERLAIKSPKKVKIDEIEEVTPIEEVQAEIAKSEEHEKIEAIEENEENKEHLEFEEKIDTPEFSQVEHEEEVEEKTVDDYLPKIGKAFSFQDLIKKNPDILPKADNYPEKIQEESFEPETEEKTPQIENSSKIQTPQNPQEITLKISPFDKEQTENKNFKSTAIDEYLNNYESTPNPSLLNSAITESQKVEQTPQNIDEKTKEEDDFEAYLFESLQQSIIEQKMIDEEDLVPDKNDPINSFKNLFFE